MPVHVVKSYATAAEYRDEVGPYLLRDEALHSLALGVADRTVNQGWVREASDVPKGSFMASVWAPDGCFELAAWWSSPRALVVTGGTPEGLKALISFASGRGWFGGLLRGPRDAVQDLLCATGGRYSIIMETALHRLDTVTMPESTAPVDVSQAVAGDEGLLKDWSHLFAVECGLVPEGSPPPDAPVDLEAGRYFLAKNASGMPVSMVVITRETPRSMNLSYVYTPVQERGHGYASRIVAEVSQWVLDRGKDFCTLYTDLRNPTSNKIYRALGYQPIGQELEVDLERP